MTKGTIKPLESVILAIHSLKAKNGSSPQDIVRFLGGKYNCHPEQLRPHVQVGLKRGLALKMLVQESGLYRLQDVRAAVRNESCQIPNIRMKQLKRKKTKVVNLGRRRRKRNESLREMILRRLGRRNRLSPYLVRGKILKVKRNRHKQNKLNNRKMKKQKIKKMKVLSKVKKTKTTNANRNLTKSGVVRTNEPGVCHNNY